jgi:micrococcal nuclease
MFFRLESWLIGLTCLSCLLLATPAQAWEMRAVVVEVDDGDSFLIFKPNARYDRVRILGIDAPEIGQPYGIEAGQHLSAMIRHKEVRLICVARDKYRRMLCRVCQDGRDMSREMVAAGLAWAGHKSFRSLERASRATGSGLWQDPQPVRPGKWRKKTRR